MGTFYMGIFYGGLFLYRKESLFLARGYRYFFINERGRVIERGDGLAFFSRPPNTTHHNNALSFHIIITKWASQKYG
jgi:hypothetical protein